MTEEESSWQEQRHLENLSVISFLFVVFIFAVYEFYMLETRPSITILDAVIWFGVPAAILGPIAWFLNYEVLCYRRTEGGTFQAKRFVRRTLRFLSVELPIFAVVIVSNIAFSKIIGEKSAFYLGFGLGGLILLVLALALRFRRLQSSR